MGVLLICGAFVYNNLAPFLGLEYAGAMTMFSGLDEDAGNHFLLPRMPVNDNYAYVTVRRFEPGDTQTSEAKDFQALLRWLSQQREAYRVNLNLVRYHANGVCRSAPGASVGLSVVLASGQRRDYENVCAEPGMFWYSALSSIRECKPDCRGGLLLVARGSLQEK